MMLIVSLAAQFAYLLAAASFSAIRAIRRKSVVEGALILYGLGVLWILLFSALIPGLLVSLGADRHVVVHSFPEAIGNLPVILFGWCPSLVFIVLVRGGHILAQRGTRLLRRRRPPHDVAGRYSTAPSES